MKCDEMQELLSLYIDKKLDESEIKALEEHLSACDTCRREYNELRDMIGLLGQSEMAPVPDAFSFRLKRALKDEKQSMIEAGIIDRGAAKKKKRWRVIASVAAVFMVGVLSFGFYDDVLGTLTDQIGGKDQTGTARSEASSDTYSGSADSSADDAGAYKSMDNSEDAAVKQERDSRPQSMAKSADPAAVNDAQSNSAKNEKEKETAVQREAPSVPAPEMLYDIAGGSDANTGDGAAASGAADTEGKSIPSCSRSLTDSGIERGAAPAQYYEDLIQKKLADFDYQILGSEYLQTGELQFTVFIFRDKDGNTYNEEIKITGKDKEIKVVYTNEFMELFQDEDDNNRR